MGLRSIVMSEQPGKLNVEIPPTRHDVLHQCDIMEDVAISYGYSNLIPLLPPTPTVASQFPLNNLTSKLRAGVAQAGFTEVLTFSLVTKAHWICIYNTYIFPNVKEN
jgi:phenylalanyl-tRNA synthetase beta chain